VLLGSYRATSSAIESPAPINYLAVQLNAGQSWRYTPPLGHTVLWIALASGTVSAPDMLRGGDLAVFAPSNEPVEFEALSDTEFVLGSAAPHEHDLVTVTIRFIPRKKHFAMARRTSCQLGTSCALNLRAPLRELQSGNADNQVYSGARDARRHCPKTRVQPRTYCVGIRTIQRLYCNFRLRRFGASIIGFIRITSECSECFSKMRQRPPIPVAVRQTRHL